MHRVASFVFYVLPLLLLPVNLAAQNLTGRVTDAATGEPVSGVNVVALAPGEDTASAATTLTDTEGDYSIRVPDGPTALVFSRIGYRSEEVPIDGRTRIDIALQVQAMRLDEIVAVGYGRQQRMHVTGSVSTVTTDDLQGRPVASVGNGLQGLMPGVTVVNHTGLPGQGAGTIRIRGVSTWGDASPLIVVDGIPGGNMNILNPQDIESVSVLKDAAAAAIYGVRGSNGVILITTKQGGRDTAPRISYSTQFGTQRPTALPEFTSSVEYMELLNEAMVNASLSPTYSQQDIEAARSGANPDRFANTDWIDEIQKGSAPQQTHNVSVRGGVDDVVYYASYGYLREGGLVRGDNFFANRHNARLRLSTTIRDRLEIDANLGYVDRDYSGSSVATGAGCCGPLYRAHQIPPLVPVRFSNGSWATTPGGLANPVALAVDGGTNAFESQEFTGNINASLSLFEGLSLRGQYGQIRSNSKRNVFARTIDYYNPEDGARFASTNSPNSIENRDYTSRFHTLAAMLDYDRVVAGEHQVRGLIGVSREATVSEQFDASRRELPTQEVGSINLGSSDFQNSASASQNALQSVFGRAGYAFDDRYFAEWNFRYDGSSRFHPDVRWNLFSAASLAWVISEEPFFEPLRSVIPSAKLRLAYGTQGNDRVGSDFPYLSLLSPVQSGSMMPIGNEPIVGFRHNVAANPMITWETAVKRNVGLDLLVLGGRLGLSGEVFINETRDILLNPPVPSVFGYGTSHPPQNAGEIENRGWEIEASWRDTFRGLRYSFSFNLADVRNRVTDLGDVEAAPADRVRMIDHPLDAFYGLVDDGIAQAEDFTYDEATDVYTANFPMMVGDPVAPGDIKYRDLNGDGVITLEDDRQVIGSHIPRYTYGLRGEVGWRGLDVGFFLQGVGRVDGYIEGAGRHAFVSVSAPIPQKVHLERWTPENPDASYPRLTHLLEHNTRLSTFWLEDASYLRLKNVQVGYTLPAQLATRVGAERLRVYGSADNLFTSTDFFYAYDPESPVNSGGYYPQVRTLVIGAEIDF